jgi:hypothetical protein
MLLPTHGKMPDRVRLPRCAWKGVCRRATAPLHSHFHTIKENRTCYRGIRIINTDRPTGNVAVGGKLNPRSSFLTTSLATTATTVVDLGRRSGLVCGGPMGRGGATGIAATLVGLVVGIWVLGFLQGSNDSSASQQDTLTLITDTDTRRLVGGIPQQHDPPTTLHAARRSSNAGDAMPADSAVGSTTSSDAKSSPGRPAFRASKTGSVAATAGISKKSLGKRSSSSGSSSHTEDDDALTHLLRSVQEDGLVVATTTDHGYLDLTINWVCHLRALHLDNKVIVFALDENIHNEMLARGIASYYEKAMTKSSDKVGNWNSKSYNQVVHTKTKHQVAVLERGYNLLFADVDIPWTSDMRAQIKTEAADGVDFLGQQNWPQNDMNTGFMFVRSNANMIRFFRSVLALEHRLETGEVCARAHAHTHTHTHTYLLACSLKHTYALLRALTRLHI